MEIFYVAHTKFEKEKKLIIYKQNLIPLILWHIKHEIWLFHETHHNLYIFTVLCQDVENQAATLLLAKLWLCELWNCSLMI